MPRQARLDAPGTLRHVILRGTRADRGRSRGPRKRPRAARAVPRRHGAAARGLHPGGCESGRASRAAISPLSQQRITTRFPAAEILGLDYGTAEEAFASARRDAERRVLPGGGGVPKWVTAMRRLVKSKGITVRSRTGLFTFGAGLPDDEVRYLHALIVRALGALDGRRW